MSILPQAYLPVNFSPSSGTIVASPAACLDVQGALFKLKVPGGPRGPVPWVRGCVRTFSAASRKRLLELFSRLVSSFPALFITLTYPSEFPGVERSKRDFRAWLKRLCRAYPQAAVVWRFAFQRRGAPHFHLLLFGVKWLDHEVIRSWWRDVIGYEGPMRLQVDVSLVRGRRQAQGYVAKYIGKVDDQLDNASYLPASGRCWGVINSMFLPWASRVVAVAAVGPWVYQLKRAVRRFLKGKGRRFYSLQRSLRQAAGGCTVFSDSPLAWLGLVVFSGCQLQEVSSG
jgi:hypothetical protein